MRKIMSLILALTMILSFGSFVASAATTEATNVTTVAPINYASASGVKIRTINGDLTSTNTSAILTDDDNSSFTTSNYTSYAPSVGALRNGSRGEIDNIYLMVTLPQEQPVSAIVLDQWKNRIDEYRVFATSNEAIARQVNDLAKDTALSEEDNGIIDQLIADGALVASGDLNGDNELSTAKNTIVFNNEKKAKYIIFVIDSVPTKTYDGGAATIIDYVAVLGNNSGLVKSSVNYADKATYPAVTGVRADADNDTAGYAGVINDIFSEQKTGTKNDYSAHFTHLNKISESKGTDADPRGWFLIDLGEEQEFDNVTIYQFKNRLKDVQLYSVTQAGYENLDKASNHLADSFVNNSAYATQLWSGTFDHGTNTGTILNANRTSYEAPDAMDFTSTRARYIIVTYTKLVHAGTGSTVHAVHVNGTRDYAYKSGNDVEFNVQLFNGSNTDAQNFVVFALHMDGDDLVDVTKVATRTLDSMKGVKFTESVAPVAGATSIRFMVLNQGTLVPLDVVRSITL